MTRPGRCATIADVRWRSVVCLIVPVCLVSGSTSLLGQRGTSETATYQSAVSYVQVRVRVLDRRGVFTRGLTRNDFQVSENGIAQTIADFMSVENAALSQSNQASQRRYMLVIDDLLLEHAHTLKAKDLIRAFVARHLTATDLVSVVLASERRVHDFTSNRATLLAAIEELQGNFDPTTDQFAIRFLDRSLRKAILGASEWLGDTKNRHKILVVISPRAPCLLRVTTSREIVRDTQDISCRDLFTAATKTNVSIYTFDPRGSTVPKCVTAEWAGDQCAGLTVRGASAQWRSRQAGATTLAEETGGFAVMATNNFEPFFERLVRENSEYYLIGYYSTNTRMDGKFRNHTVKVKQRGLTVNHRSGYVAAAGQ